MAPFPLSRDGACPSCQSKDVAYVLQARHFAVGMLAPVFRILLKTQRAVIGLEQVATVSELPTMVCCGLCTMTPSLRGGYNLDWRSTNLQAAFSLTRDMIQAEEREPVDMRLLLEYGQNRLQQLHAVIPNTAPAIDRQDTSAHHLGMPSSSSSLQATIASTLRSVRKECELREQQRPVRPKPPSKPSTTTTASPTPATSSSKKSRFSDGVKNVSLRETLRPHSEASAPAVEKVMEVQNKWKSVFPSESTNVPVHSDGTATSLPATNDKLDGDAGPAGVDQTVGSDKSSAVNKATQPAAVESEGSHTGPAHGKVGDSGLKGDSSKPTDTPDCDPSAADDGEVSDEADSCPEGVSSTVWRFYRDRVLKPQNSNLAAQPSKLAEQGDDEQTSDGVVSSANGDCQQSTESWNAVNVHELLRASNNSFSNSFDEKAARLRVAALRKKSRSAKKVCADQQEQVLPNTDTLVMGTVSHALLSAASLDRTKPVDDSPPPALDLASKDRGNFATHPGDSGKDDSQAMLDEPPQQIDDVQSSAEPGASAEENQSYGQDADSAVTSHSGSDHPAPAPSCDGDGIVLPPSHTQSAVTSTRSVQTTSTLSIASIISASPAVDHPDTDAPGSLYPRLAASSSPFAYPYGAVLASSTTNSLASIVPFQRPGLGSSSVPGTLANPSKSLPTLVVYSSGDEDSSDDESEESSKEHAEDDENSESEFPSNVDEWQVLDEATSDGDGNDGTDGRDATGSAADSGGNARAVDGKAEDNSASTADQEGGAEENKIVYPVSMTGACPYCFSSDVVYIILCPDSNPDAELRPLLRNLLLCKCAKKLPPPTDGQEVPSFQCRSCGYGFNLNWVATSLEAIFGVNDEPLEQEEEVANDDATQADSPDGDGSEEQKTEEDDGWEIYWQQLTPQQQADYQRWHAAHQMQQVAVNTDSTPAAEADSDPGTAVEGSTAGDDAKEAAKELSAKTERQLLAMQPEGVRELEALLSHIDKNKAQQPEPPTVHEEDQVQEQEDDQPPEDSSSAKKPWWQIVGDSQDPAMQSSLLTVDVAQTASSSSTAAAPIASSSSSMPPVAVQPMQQPVVQKKPQYVTSFEQYSVQGTFNPLTGKFQNASAAKTKSPGEGFGDVGLRHLRHHLDSSSLVVESDQPEPKKPKLSWQEVEKLKAKKAARKREALVRASRF